MKKMIKKVWKTLQHKALILLLLLNPINSYGVTETWQKPKFITKSFFEVALGFEYRSVAQKVRKWTKPVRIYVDHQVGSKEDKLLHDALLDAHIIDLREITNIDMRRVKSIKQANIHYYFTSQQKLPALVKRVSGKSSLKHLKTSVCMATMRASRSGEINSAVVYIAVNQARMHAKLVSCIVEELTQVLGLPRDSDKVFPSIFNDRSTDDLQTGLDIVLLKLLYNTSIKAGMGKAQLRPILRGILNKWQKQGKLQKAAKKSRTLALCQFMEC